MHQIQSAQILYAIISPRKRMRSGKERKSHIGVKFALIGQLNEEITAVIWKLRYEWYRSNND